MRHQHSSEKRRFVRSVQRLRTLNIGTENVSFRKGLGEGAGRAEHLHQIFWARSLASPHLKGLALQPFLFFF